MSIKGITKNISQSLLIDLIKTGCLYVLSLCGWDIIVKIAVKAFVIDETLSRPLWIFLSFLSILIITCIIKKKHRFMPYFPKMNCDYKLLRKEITHEYQSLEKILHTRSYKIKALKDGVAAFRIKFHWTGGDYHIYCSDKKYTLVEIGTTNLYNFYEVILPATLKKGEIAEIEIKWDLDNSAHRAIPFFSTTIEEPTEELVMNIILPPVLGVKEVCTEMSSTLGAQLPLDITTVQLDKHGEYKWVVKKPQLLYVYQIKWFH